MPTRDGIKDASSGGGSSGGASDQVKNFKYVWPVTGTSATVVIPGANMLDTAYGVDATISAVPSGGSLATFSSDPDTQTVSQFVLTASGSVLANTVLNIQLDDQ